MAAVVFGRGYFTASSQTAFCVIRTIFWKWKPFSIIMAQKIKYCTAGRNTAPIVLISGFPCYLFKAVRNTEQLPGTLLFKNQSVQKLLVTIPAPISLCIQFYLYAPYTSLFCAFIVTYGGLCSSPKKEFYDAPTNTIEVTRTHDYLKGMPKQQSYWIQVGESKPAWFYNYGKDSFWFSIMKAEYKDRWKIISEGKTGNQHLLL